MELYIDTAANNMIKIAIRKDSAVLHESVFEAKYRQCEMLLPAIDRLLKNNHIDKKSLRNIRVNEQGDGFSSLRIGVVIANALAFGLGIPVYGEQGNAEIKMDSYNIVLPKYNKEPNIG